MMDAPLNQSWILSAMAWLAGAGLLFLAKLFISHHHSSLKLPPGPKPWPIIGNLNLIGPLPHRSLHKLAQQYGHIMQLRFGSFPVVVASSAEMAKQILKTNDEIFASRPKFAAGKYTAYNYSNVLWAPYGEYWRQGRKLYLNELFNSKRLQSYEYIRVEEMHNFLSGVHSLSCSGKAVLLKDHLSHYTLSILSRIVLGKKYSSAESESQTNIVTPEEFQEMLDELFSLNGVFHIGDWIPWLDFLDLQGYVKRMKALKIKFDRFHDHVISEHRIKRKGALLEDSAPKNIVDHMLQLADNPDLDIKLNTDSVKGFSQEIIGGGKDTAAAAVEWAMSELMKHPNLVKKATDELDRVVGKQRWVEEKDIPNLPYIDAIMKETMRKHPVGTMLAPRLATKDCKVGGYDILKGSRVVINTWSMGRDPSIWDEPEEFRPERFLDKTIDVKGQSFELLPFGSGRRMCPGYSLGLKMIRSCLANLLHGFNWKLPDNMKPEDLSMDEVYGLATLRKSPLVAVAEPRLPLHLY
ncbi:trimethyltridecatetraene synthase [Ricinus communis]|uniref:Flavonoid 3-hydroxylase, putative n=1 Tax=Ricinus communis TaxID=3988 RepID=B9RRA1_RICCO|nr:trimethyltridecatetraene synthase [Ricinus communis]EEF46272.1 flavonoid 3-hydroxylase, putative [Ricinus communis]|eukprot:XP_002516270.1 cytochrome P450 71A1 [Ricinus communis]